MLATAGSRSRPTSKARWPYSYTSEDGTIYAEEDCDCGHIFRAAESKNIELNINPIDVNGESFVRTLPRCS